MVRYIATNTAHNAKTVWAVSGLSKPDMVFNTSLSYTALKCASSSETNWYSGIRLCKRLTKLNYCIISQNETSMLPRSKTNSFAPPPPPPPHVPPASTLSSASASAATLSSSCTAAFDHSFTPSLKHHLLPPQRTSNEKSCTAGSTKYTKENVNNLLKFVKKALHESINGKNLFSSNSPNKRLRMSSFNEMGKILKQSSTNFQKWKSQRVAPFATSCLISNVSNACD